MGEGYSDIFIQTPDGIGIVIELKYADDGNLEVACAKALKQIEEKKYAKGLNHRSIKKIVKYGMAFCERVYGCDDVNSDLDFYISYIPDIF